ncbi:hypothetical protein GCM10023178_24700 [Actinomadura luteofluorescens]
MYSWLVPTGHIGGIFGSSSLIAGPFGSVGGMCQFDIGLYDNEPADVPGSPSSGGMAAGKGTRPGPSPRSRIRDEIGRYAAIRHIATVRIKKAKDL